MNDRDFKLFARDHHVSGQLLDDYMKFQNSYIEPYIVEERRLNATQISVFSRLFMERILFLGMEINSDVANIVNSQLLYLQTENPDKAITMYINSPGGSVYDGMSIYDVAKYVSCPIATTCCGTAASMAAVLLSSGDKGMRTALPHSQIMIHQPSGGTGRVQAADMEIAWKEMKKCEVMLYNVLAENTGKSFDEIEALCDRDKWYTAAEAVKEGLIDSVITKKKK
jgi:ATP-dependent Clp protease protease subunit